MKKEIIKNESALKLNGCTLSKTGASFENNLNFEKWKTAGESIAFMNGASMFWLGDWCNFGETNYGEKYAQALEDTEYDYGTLANASWVCKQVEFSRRRENLPFSHHQQVASLDAPEQEEFLEIATEEGLSLKDFRQKIKAVKRKRLSEKAAIEFPPSIDLIEGDFTKKGDGLPDGVFDLVLTDPPYPAEFLPLWDELGKLAARTLKPSGFLVAYSGQLYLDQVVASLSKHLSWYWLAGLHHLGPCAFRHERNARNVMKPILVFQKIPVAKQATSFGDLIESPAPSKEFHEWGQSTQPLETLIDTFCPPGGKILDPMAGGGSTGVSALKLGRSCTMIEIDAENIGIIKTRFK